MSSTLQRDRSAVAPDASLEPAASPPVGRPAKLQAPTSRLRIVAGLFVLLWLGVLLEGLFVALWPISYDLTQGVDFSYEYLLQYQDVWEWFRPLL